jgi:hypothetical protein
VGQIATTVGLTVLAQAGMEMWGILEDLGLVDSSDELVVRNILASARLRLDSHYNMRMTMTPNLRRADLGSA